jgi:hypothetical protein
MRPQQELAPAAIGLRRAVDDGEVAVPADVVEPARVAVLGVWLSTRSIPGTSGYDLNQKIESLRSAAGLTSLQAMRQASPTGGALGQVSDRENAILQNALAALDPNQSPQAFREQLQRIEAYVQRTQKRLQAAFQEQYGAGQGPSSSPTASDPLGIR